MSGVLFSRLPGRAGLSEFRSATRPDPLGFEWPAGGSASYYDMKKALLPGASLLAWMTHEEDDQTRLELRVEEAAQVVAVVAAWQALTPAQVEGFTGRALSPSLLRSMVRTGLLEIATVQVPHRRAPETFVLRTGPGLSAWIRRIPWLVRMRATGGNDLPRHSAHDRHNILSAEVALRVAEHGKGVAFILPETYARYRDILLWHPQASDAPRALADSLWIREDGVRIAVEVTRRTGRDFADKLAALESAMRLGNRTYVLMLCETPQARDKVVSVFRTMTLPKLQGALAVASIQDWFPDTGEAAMSFPDLPAELVYSTGTRSVNLATAPMLSDLRHADEAGFLERVRALWVTPWWEREGAAMDWRAWRRSEMLAGRVETRRG